MELAFDAEKAAEFVNGIVPANVANSIAKMGEPSNFTFNQYNTSPKSLSRREIRRDTIEGLQLAKALR